MDGAHFAERSGANCCRAVFVVAAPMALGKLCQGSANHSLRALPDQFGSALFGERDGNARILFAGGLCFCTIALAGPRFDVWADDCHDAIAVASDPWYRGFW